MPLIGTRASGGRSSRRAGSPQIRRRIHGRTRPVVEHNKPLATREPSIHGPSPMASPEIREEMKDIAGKRRRFGYRRIGVLLERKGMIMNHKKLYRLYREDGGGSENSPGDCFRSCRECGGNCRAAGSGHVTMAPVRPRGQGTLAREAGTEFPSHRPFASGSDRKPAAPRAASARFRRRAARSGS